MDYSKLKGLMREKGVTQAELAKKIGISESSLNLKLNDKTEFKQREISKICEILNIIGGVDLYFFTKKL